MGEDSEPSKGQNTSHMVLSRYDPSTDCKAWSRVILSANGWHQYSYRPNLVPSVYSLLVSTDTRCSPVQWLGPSRFTQPPCPITSLPPIDIVIISQYVMAFHLLMP